MRVDLAGRAVLVIGERGPVLDAITDGLTANGAQVTRVDAGADAQVPDIVVLASELRAEAALDGGADLAGLAEALAPRMVARGGGRIVFLLGAIGTLPARRYPEQSAVAATLVFRMRGLAMRSGPSVLVNAIGAGAIAADASRELVAGAEAMLSHVPTGRPGSMANLVDAVLFLCDPLNTYMTGQVLVVDGGWSTGYGRNF